MARQSPFPSKQADFDTYVNRAIPYLDTEKVRLSVNNAKITQLKAWLSQWNDLFAKNQDPAERTPKITKDKNKMRNNITVGLREVYADIPESALTSTDREKLNLPERDTVPTARPAIEVSPYVNIEARVGSRIAITCRTDTDASRASMLPAADAIEVRYKVGGEEPTTAEEAPEKEIFSKAKSILKLVLESAGKRLWIYVRWKNTSDDSKSGPWSTKHTLIITD